MTILSNTLPASTWAGWWLIGVPDVMNRNMLPRIKKVFNKHWLNEWMSEWTSERIPSLPLSVSESLLGRCLWCFKLKAPTQGLDHWTLVLQKQFMEPETGFQPKDINLWTCHEHRKGTAVPVDHLCRPGIKSFHYLQCRFSTLSEVWQNQILSSKQLLSTNWMLGLVLSPLHINSLYADYNLTDNTNGPKDYPVSSWSYN